MLFAWRGPEGAWPVSLTRPGPSTRPAGRLCLKSKFRSAIRSAHARHAQVGSTVARASSSAQQDEASSREYGSGSLALEDKSKFVRFMHLASPYVMGHRGKTFVLVLPGEVIQRKDRMALLLDDVALLHGLGVKLVIVCGAKPQIDEYLRTHGHEPRLVGAYRVTDALALQGALKAAGTISTEVSAHLSKAPSIPMVRRHARGGEGQIHFAPTVQIVNGNYVTAKRRGIVKGVDFGLMGQVRYVQRTAIMQQLQAGNVVLLTNVGVSAAGELLNCNAFDVATHAAVELKADKLLCLTTEDVRELQLPHYLPLDDAEQLITSSVCEFGDADCLLASLDGLDHASLAVDSPLQANGGVGVGGPGTANGGGSSSSSSNGSGNGYGSGIGNGSGSPSASSPTVELNLDLDSWQQIGYPNAVLAAVVACKNGVKRAHLIDIDTDGAMLLELYTRDGINGVCMIAADLYEGIRPAQLGDQAEVATLLSMLRDSGFELPFPLSDLANRLGCVTVMEREGKILGCACYVDAGTAADGISVGEITAIIIHPGYRRAGLGDSLLDFVEQELRQKGFRRIALVVDAGSVEFFTRRDFELVGYAADSELLPLERRLQLPGGALSQLYVKPIVELDASVNAPAGKRIGF